MNHLLACGGQLNRGLMMDGKQHTFKALGLEKLIPDMEKCM
jgi:hypothetical protein